MICVFMLLIFETLVWLVKVFWKESFYLFAEMLSAGN